MRVCIVIDHWFPTIGGGPIQVRELVKRLATEQDIQLEIVTSKLSTYALRSKIQDNLKSFHFRITQLGLAGSFSSPFHRLIFLYSLFFYLWRIDFDILHVHPFTPLLIAKLVAVFKKRAVVLTIHSRGVELFGKGRLLWLWQYLNSYLTFNIRYDGQIFVDRDLMRVRSPTTQKFFIPNGVDVTNFDKIQTVKSKKFRFLFVGRFHPQKNLSSLIRAFSIFVGKKSVKAELVLVGDGYQSTVLKRLVSELKLKKFVHFNGVLFGNRLIKAYKSADILILPSRYEGFPLTILEAWAAKIPVATTATGELKRLVLQGKTGLITQGSSVDALFLLLQKSYNSRQLTKMGLQGYRLVRERYSWDQAAKKTYYVYKTILKKNAQN